MLIRHPRRWELPEATATPESAFLNRRQLLAGMGLGAGLIALQPRPASAATPIDGVFPAKRNPAYKLDRDLTPEDVNSKYNNFYEFTPGKQVYAAIGDFKPFPWTVTIDGMVEEEKKLDIEKLVATMPVEERLYRHRCVEAWSMTVPWTGFPLKALLDFARPLSSAKYVRFETFSDPGMAPELGNFLYPWPYVEGVTLEEATNDLAFMVIGAYGKPLLGQFGAPLRLALPWKYGFKSIKSIVRITFTDERPVNFWQQLQSSEYGFWANVNPDVPHPRWSQAEERVLGSGAYVPTLLYNGYAEEVAGLYKGLESEPLFM
jgi:methionine sulfoxide reductase catalytic subunit